MKLFRIITLMLLVLTTGPITAVGYILIDSTVDITKTLTWELQQERADHASRQTAATFINVADDLDLLVGKLNVGSMNVQQRQELLSFILQRRPELNIVGLYDAQGKIEDARKAFEQAHILNPQMKEASAWLKKHPGK